MVTQLPFVEKGCIRSFSHDVDPNDLHWHWDEQDRLVSVVEDNDWFLQLDNQLPKPMKGTMFIPKGMFHRLIKGTTDLHVYVVKVK